MFQRHPEKDDRTNGEAKMACLCTPDFPGCPDYPSSKVIMSAAKLQEV